MALMFGPAELAMLIVFALVVVAGTGARSQIKGLISTALGMLLATVGLDPITTQQRFTFGSIDLDAGIELLAMLIGLSFNAVQGKGRKKRLLILTLFVALYGFSDEFHQYFVPGRDPSFWDLCADTSGGFLAAYFLLRKKQRLSRKKPPSRLDIPKK